MTRDEFWSSTMRTYNSYDRAFRDKRKIKDEEQWHLGIYMMSAFSTVLSNAFSKKSDAKYLEKPLFDDIEYAEKQQNTEDEKIDMQSYKTAMTLRIMQANYNLNRM